jgi:hypothetical protein
MINWHDQGLIYGINVKSFFFDADAAQKEQSLPQRILPFLDGTSINTLFTEQDKKNFFHGELVAQPDAVFEHGNGLISVEFKSVSGRLHNPENWSQQIRLKDMLQCVIAGYAVAQNYKKQPPVFFVTTMSVIF